MPPSRLLHPLSAMRAFETVARLGTVSAAADDLGVTQPAISQQVKKLEKHVGVGLIERVSNRIELTPQGIALASHLHSAFGVIRQGLEQVMGGGQVTLAVLSSFAQRWLIPRMADLQQKYPDIDLRLVTRPTLLDIERSDADLVIVPKLRSVVPEDSVLMEDDAWLVLSPELQRRKPITVVGDVDRHMLIRVEEHPRDRDWEVWRLAAGMEELNPQGWHNFSNSSHALEAAVAGVGVFIGHRSMLIDAMTTGRLVSPLVIRIAEDVVYGILEPQHRSLSPQAALVKQWLKEQVAEDKKRAM